MTPLLNAIANDLRSPHSILATAFIVVFVLWFLWRGWVASGLFGVGVAAGVAACAAVFILATAPDTKDVEADRANQRDDPNATVVYTEKNAHPLGPVS
jgi:4-hydroxybenzoate polyprenyltransferase